MDRNPLVLPEYVQTKRCCPKCKAEDYTGRNLGGQIRYTCKVCKSSWLAGLPQEPWPPDRPHPPEQYRPPVEQIMSDKGVVVEIKRPVSNTQDFRKGLPIPSGERNE